MTYQYGEAPKELQDIAETLRETAVLEDVAEFVSTAFRLPFSVNYVAKSCGEPNAFWTPNDQTVTLCYELIDYYADLIIKDIAERQP